MSQDLNQCSFIGRLGKDPEVRYLSNGDPVCSFSIAVGETWKDKNTGEKVEKTEWVNCSVFGKLAEIAGQYLAKGKQCFVSGKMQTRKWEDKEGATRYTTEIKVDRLQLLGGRDDAKPAQSGGAKSPQKATAGGFDDDSEIPF